MRQSRTAARCRIALLLAVSAVVSACSQGSGTFAASHSPTGAQTVLVALGGNEAPGFALSRPAQDWAQLFYGEALSRRSTLYDLSSTNGPYVQNLLAGEVAQALELHPGLVAVWVGMPDLLGGMPPATFEQDLEQVLGDLDQGRAQVLVANLLPIYLFPTYRACEAQPSSCGLFAEAALPSAAQLKSAVASYDQVIGAAASHARASVVDLTAVFTGRLDSANRSGSAGTSGSAGLVDQSDLGLTEAGEQLVAGAFESAYSARH